MKRKLVVFMNESRNHKAILDQLLADHESDEIYRSLDDKIIKSHCKTKKAIDNVINNNIENTTIYTYDTSSLSFYLTRYGFDLYVCNQNLDIMYEDGIPVLYPASFISKVVLTERPDKNHMNFIKLV